jgi:hypothetical protein
VVFLTGLALAGTVAEDARAEILSFTKDFSYTNGTRESMVALEKFDPALGRLNRVLFDFKVQSAPDSTWSVEARPDPILIYDPLNPLGVTLIPGTAIPNHRVDFSVVPDISITLTDYHDHGRFALQVAEAEGRNLSFYEGADVPLSRVLLTRVVSVLGADFIPSGRVSGGSTGKMIGTIGLVYEYTRTAGLDPIPEPSMLAGLAGLGITGWLLVRRRKPAA